MFSVRTSVSELKIYLRNVTLFFNYFYFLHFEFKAIAEWIYSLLHFVGVGFDAEPQ